MTTPPPEDEGLQMVRRDGPKPHRLHAAVPKTEPQILEPEGPEPFSFFTIGRVCMIAGIVLFIGFLVGSGYLIRQLHREAGVPKTPAPSIAAETAAVSTIVPVTPDMLRVTSIALGKVPLVVINGKRMAEGDSLELKTPAGVAALRVVKIEDGVVHLKNDGQMIDVRLSATLGQKNPPH